MSMRLRVWNARYIYQSVRRVEGENRMGFYGIAINEAINEGVNYIHECPKPGGT